MKGKNKPPEYKLKDDLTKKDRWNRLLEPKTSKVIKLEREKNRKSNQDFEENCTFKPNLGKRP